MYTIKELLAAKDKHNHRDEQRAVYEAVDILAGELFTGIDIVTFLSADRALIEQAITDRLKLKTIQVVKNEWINIGRASKKHTPK